MIKLDKDSIIRQYEESGKIMYRATLDGDYKTNNKEGDKLTKIFKVFEKDRTDVGEAVLEEISHNSQNGIFGYNAEMTLQVWRETGKLEIYQKR